MVEIHVECGCGLYVTSSKERTLTLFCRERGREALGQASSGDFKGSDVESSTSLTSAGDLSLSCSFSPLESEESLKLDRCQDALLHKVI